MTVKTILIGCEESGTIRDAFIRRGYHAVSCDLQPSRTPGPHYQGDIFDVIGANWDMFIVHPPCTFLSSSGLHWNTNPKSPRYGGKQTDAALEFVCKLWARSAHIPRRAWENPIGCITTRLGMKVTQIIQPYNFGNDASKATCLGLDGLPQLVSTQFVPPRYVCCGSAFPYSLGKYGCPNCGGKKAALPRWANQTDSGQNRLGPSADRAKIRSQTYPGIAEAIVSQWGRLI